MRTVVIIPARYGSSRFPGKPLVPLLGKPMVLWVADLSAKAVGQENVYIATEDTRISKVAEDAGYKAILTSSEALTGTDRLAQASDKINADIYINVQGDEPLVNPVDILRICDAKKDHMDAVINGFCWVSKDEDVSSLNIPKVITNECDEMVYMSRSVIPGYKDHSCSPIKYKKQVCIYAFTREELAEFRDYGRKSRLEYCEDIEILRFLEMNKKVIMVETTPGSLAVDEPNDVGLVTDVLSRQFC